MGMCIMYGGGCNVGLARVSGWRVAIYGDRLYLSMGGDGNCMCQYVASGAIKRSVVCVYGWRLAI